ncbi:hypothetical protein LZ32DRAFT_611828 [Colletotrichum eremochloae]|nr:hypothetical protein LZ32DRAFT_611828 [Colletotrichum eremochloae]
MKKTSFPPLQPFDFQACGLARHGGRSTLYPNTRRLSRKCRPWPSEPTGQKPLFVNSGFTKKIIRLRDEELDALRKLLLRYVIECWVKTVEPTGVTAH